MRSPAGRSPRRLDLCDVGTVRAVARRVGLVASRRRGQNFLLDRSVVETIVDALDPGADDEVLEIGPGMGTLTTALADRARRVVGIELDEACVRALEVTLRGVDNVEVVQGDALRVDIAALQLRPGWLAAGNIPYTITGALLQHLLEMEEGPRRCVLLVQREVAARLAAGPGDWSLATVAVRSLAGVERLRDVPPTAFDPQPAVHSSVIRLTPSPAVPPAERAAVLATARAAFQMRRKTLRHGVTHAARGNEAVALAALQRAHIDAARRPGTLGLEEWRALAAALAEEQQ